MTGYRDARDAQQARIDALEETLAERTRELETMRGGGSAEERLERLGKELAHAQAEMARLRELVKPRPKTLAPAIAGVAALVMLVGGAAALVLARRDPVRESAVVIVTSVPPPEVSSPPPSPPPAVAPPPAAIAEPPPPLKPPPEIRLATTWKGRVKSVKGGQVVPGAPCILSASFARKLGARAHEERIELTCGGKKLYDNEDELSGMSSQSLDVHEHAGGAGYVHSIAYEDKGPRSGARSEISLDSGQREAKVWRTGVGGYDLIVALDPEDAGTREPLYPEKSISTCTPYKSPGRVVEIAGEPGVAVGDTCEVELRAAKSIECQVFVTCGAKKLYAGGYALRRDTAFVDAQPSVEDKDPKVAVDPYWKTARVEDGTTITWRVDIDLDR